MLINFTIKNFRSFWDMNSVSFKPTPNLKELTKFIALYGPNASGKSNIAKALAYVQFAVQNTDSVNNTTLEHPLLQPFLFNKEGNSEPSFFELEVLDMASETIYRYGFTVSKTEVVAEWLFERARRSQNTTERKLFTRDLNGIKFNARVPSRIKALRGNISKSILALAYFANNNYQPAYRIVEYISKKTIIFDGSDFDRISQIANERMVKDPSLLKEVTSIVHNFDLSVKEININQAPASQEQIEQLQKALPQLKPLLGDSSGIIRTDTETTHSIYDSQGNISGVTKLGIFNESLGTQKLIPFITMLVDAMRDGALIVIDEFGASFHPFITNALVELFVSRKHNSQLLTLTHETFILNNTNCISMDSFWFVEKNRKEESNIFALSEYKPRSDAKIDKQYLEGRFGAVPVVFKAKDVSK